MKINDCNEIIRNNIHYFNDSSICPYYGDRKGEYCFYKEKYNPGCGGLMWFREDKGYYVCLAGEPIDELVIGCPIDVEVINLIKIVCNRKGLGEALKKTRGTKE